MYAMSERTKSIFPIAKKINADSLGSDAKVMVIISIMAVNTPPRAK